MLTARQTGVHGITPRAPERNSQKSSRGCSSPGEPLPLRDHREERRRPDPCQEGTRARCVGERRAPQKYLDGSHEVAPVRSEQCQRPNRRYAFLEATRVVSVYTPSRRRLSA